MKSRALLMSLLFASAASALACNTADDTTLTVRVQSRLNEVVGPDSNVDVRVTSGVATLTGLASSEAAHARALAAARGIEGVRGVRDEISTVPTTTGATVPTPGGSVTPPVP
jgi:shikimate kinase